MGTSPLPPSHTPRPRTQITKTAVKATTSAQPSPETPLHHERQLKTSSTPGSFAPPCQHEPCAPSQSLRAGNTTNQPPPLPSQSESLDAAPPMRVRRQWRRRRTSKDEQGFHPKEPPCSRNMVPHNSAPNKENDATRTPPQLPPTKASLKAFARLSTMSVVRSWPSP